jgi:hypothetical protein
LSCITPGERERNSASKDMMIVQVLITGGIVCVVQMTQTPSTRYQFFKLKHKKNQCKITKTTSITLEITNKLV